MILFLAQELMVEKKTSDPCSLSKINCSTVYLRNLNLDYEEQVITHHSGTLRLYLSCFSLKHFNNIELLRLNIKILTIGWRYGSVCHPEGVLVLWLL